MGRGLHPFCAEASRVGAGGIGLASPLPMVLVDFLPPLAPQGKEAKRAHGNEQDRPYPHR